MSSLSPTSNPKLAYHDYKLKTVDDSVHCHAKVLYVASRARNTDERAAVRQNVKPLVSPKKQNKKKTWIHFTTDALLACRPRVSVPHTMTSQRCKCNAHHTNDPSRNLKKKGIRDYFSPISNFSIRSRYSLSNSTHHSEISVV